MRASVEELVKHVQDHPGITPAKLAELFGVSTRSIRAYIQQANAALGYFAHIELAPGHGYHLVVNDEGAFGAWEAAVRAQGATPQTPEERIFYLLNDLLLRPDWVRLGYLCSRLFISRSTMTNDLKAVEQALGRFGLVLERRPHYGVRVAGPELSRRLCLASIIVEHMNDERLTLGKTAQDADSSVLDDLFGSVAGPSGESGSHELVSTISECVQRAASEEEFTINPAAYQNLLIHITIALLRIRGNCYVPIDEERITSLTDAREHRVAQRVAVRLADATGIELPKEEILYIALHLAGKQTINMPSDGSAQLVISDEVWALVSSMLERVWQTFRFDFRENLELRMNLAQHIAPLVVRLQCGMDLKNPILDEVKQRYSFAYSIAVEASSVLTEQFDAPLSDDEIGYIALAFALALERQQEEAPKKNILVVCASGAGSARLLEYRCQQEFGNYINRIETCDVLHLDTVDFNSIDYVFTTVSINHVLPVPVREVRHFLDARDVAGMNHVLRSHQERQGSLVSYFDRRLFFPHLVFSEKAEALDWMIAQTSEVKHVPASFGELVWQRERLVATSFGNDIAMPHPLEAFGDETFVAAGIFDEPLVWDEYGRTIRIAFLTAFSNKKGEARPLVSALADLLLNRSVVDCLLATQTWENLINILESYERDKTQ